MIATASRRKNMTQNATIRLAVIDCSVRKANLPKKIPSDIAENIPRVLENEKKNSQRLSQFYNEKAKEFSHKTGRRIEVLNPLVEEIGGLSKNPFDILIIPDSFYTPTQGLVNDNEHIKRLLELVRESHENGKFTLGVCFGHEAIGAAFGAYPTIVSSGFRQIGYRGVSTASGDPILEGLPEKFYALFNNRFQLEGLPEGAKTLLVREPSKNIVAFRTGNTYGFQYQIDYTPENLKDRADHYAQDAKANGHKINIPSFLQSFFGETIKQTNSMIVDNFLAIASGERVRKADGILA